MTTATDSAAVRGLADALRAVEEALARDDATAAAAAAGLAARLSQQLAASGDRPAPAEGARLQALHARCLARATAAQERLGVLLRQAGQSRRAETAYRRR